MMKSSEKGFALGIVMVIIVLMIALTTMASYTGTNNKSGATDLEKATGYHMLIRNQGGLIRDAYRAAVRHSNSAGADVDTGYSCTSAPLCVRATVQLKRLPNDTFSTTPNATNTYNYWAFNRNMSFGTFTAYVALLKFPIKEQVCRLIQANASGVGSTSATSIPTITSFSPPAANSAAFHGSANWVPEGAEGCFIYNTGQPAPNNRAYYYYIIIGRTQ